MVVFLFFVMSQDFCLFRRGGFFRCHSYVTSSTITLSNLVWSVVQLLTHNALVLAVSYCSGENVSVLMTWQFFLANGHCRFDVVILSTLSPVLALQHIIISKNLPFDG